MEKTIVTKNGLELRAVVCKNCKDQIIHPADLNSMQNFNSLKDKTYNVKLRVIGNSHAISIPKEIVEFIQHQKNLEFGFLDARSVSKEDSFKTLQNQEKMMDNMVRLCFEDMHKLSLRFGQEREENW
ncbi:MAG: hypothetical protein AABX23_02420 [Nanoarchaeota archaeon]